MTCDLTCLDYVWRGLVVGTITSSIILTILLTMWMVFRKKMSHLQNKWFLNIHLIALLSVFVSGFAFVVTRDPELASGCFSQFIKQGLAFSFTRFVAATWFVLAIGFCLFDAIRIWDSIRKSKNFIRIKDQNLIQLLDRGLKQINCKASVELYTTTESVSPFVWGFFRHKIVIPKSFLEKASQKTLQNVLAHELIHVRDHDSIWRLLELVCHRILFFNPLMLFVHSQYLLNVEKAADEEAVQAGGILACELLSSLLEVVGYSRIGQVNPILLNASRSFQEIKERMESLSDIRPARSSAFVFSWVLGLSMMTALSFSIAQAKSSIGGFAESPIAKAGMCTQVKQEQIIESWLNIEPRSNKCDTN